MPSVMTVLLDQLGPAGLRGDAHRTTDGELLERFLKHREEAAFEALLRRHGPMVLGVCRRLVGNAHEAEDAFQATFLVLVRKAAQVVPRDTIGNWLYGVAYRTALKARGLAARRNRKERQMRDMPEQALEADQHEVWLDLKPHLDQELQRLPPRYRAAVVLCDLEGKSRSEAARLLGLVEGTLSSRLARARRILAGRLAGRGLTLSMTSLALVLSGQTTAAAPPAGLLASTTQAASRLAPGEAVIDVVSAQVALLTKGVLKAMLLTRFTGVLAWVMAAALVALGAGTLGRHAWARSAERATMLPIGAQAPVKTFAAAPAYKVDDRPAKPQAQAKQQKVSDKRVTAREEIARTFTTKAAGRLIVSTFRVFSIDCRARLVYNS
jgi:RNA polymerase sigma-70 factor (ECF subfamily)